MQSNYGNDVVWATGGLGKNNFENRTQLVETKEVMSFRGNIFGPTLPEARILHCVVSINETLAFIHGGKISMNPNKIFKRFGRFKFYEGGYTIYNYPGIANKTADTSYLYDWSKQKWNKVF